MLRMKTTTDEAIGLVHITRCYIHPPSRAAVLSWLVYRINNGRGASPEWHPVEGNSDDIAQDVSAWQCGMGLGRTCIRLARICSVGLSQPGHQDRRCQPSGRR